MQLHHKKSGKGKPLIILHGLLGMLDNWQSIAKILSSPSPALPIREGVPTHKAGDTDGKVQPPTCGGVRGSFEVFLTDARNHGHSPHSAVFNYDAMAADLFEFIQEQKVLSFGEDLGEVILLGHSMGGKVAMKFAQKFPERVEKLVVVDIAPKYYSARHDNILEALLAVDLNIVKSRKEAEEILTKYISENHIRQFLLKNLYWKPHPQPLSSGEGRNKKDKLAWRFNLEAISNNIEKVGELVTDNIFNKPTLFLRGEKSDYILDSDFDLIKKYFPQSEIKTIPNAGHWIHAEQPELFVKAVKEFMKK